MPQSDLIQRLALVGARPRIVELTREINERLTERAAIFKTFPELEADAADATPVRRRAVRSDRGKRRMTDEQRADVSKRMKAYWRKKRSEK
jgi:hypothetical protein